MAREGSEAQDLQWLTQPAAPGVVHLHVAIGEGAQLSPEVQAALSQLVQAVRTQQGDVAGYGGTAPTPIPAPGPGTFGMSTVKFQGPSSYSVKFQAKLR
jgi:hypothetical protein